MQNHLLTCHCCGLIQQLIPHQVNEQLICCRCQVPLPHCQDQGNEYTALLATSALFLYLPAILLPLLHIERLGQASESSLLVGVWHLLLAGDWLVGTIILLFSVLLPPIKLLALLFSSQGQRLAHRHRALIYRLVEWVGRWGMLDVMLVAILVAFVKLGDLVSISAGPGLLAFTAMVLFSLLASVLFNPYCLWEPSA